MTVYSYRSDEVQFDGSNKLPDTEVYLKDIVDSSVSESMTTGLAKYAKGVSNEWTLDYDEVIVVLTQQFNRKPPRFTQQFNRIYVIPNRTAGSIFSFCI
jgi:hypothetical protein